MEDNQRRLFRFASVFLGAALLVGSGAPVARRVFAQAVQTDRAPAGWFLTGSKPGSYRTGVDPQMVREARPSAYLASKTADSDGFGTLMQSIGASEYAGKRVRLRAWVRSKDVADWAGVWMRVDKGEKAVGFDNMEQRAIRGTQPWMAYDVVLDVPADATGISFGTLLDGAGEVWLSDVRFDVVGQDVATTGMGGRGSMPSTPVNLDFRK
jgi:hypothetical protein